MITQNYKKILFALVLIVLNINTYGQDVYEQQRTVWAQKAEAFTPQLYADTVYPKSIVIPEKDEAAFQGWSMKEVEPVERIYSTSFKPIKEVCVDFGRHMVGYFTFELQTLARTQDAPIRFKFTMGEVPSELTAKSDPYKGTLSRAWIQDEVVTVMDVTKPITIPRRLAGRYMKIELLAQSNDFDFGLSNMYFTATTSAGENKFSLLPGTSKQIQDINKVGLETLKECMQTVYEDGPKRDRRLWIGDLYLQSLANMYSFQNDSLTKRSLYILASLSAPSGELHANIFESPEPHPQLGSHCMDYSLLYMAALNEYVKATGDLEVGNDLWAIANQQIQIAKTYLNKDNLFDEHKFGTFVWLFFDWKEGLDKQMAIQGLYSFCIQHAYELGKTLGKEEDIKEYPALIKSIRTSARNAFYDKNNKVFTSGDAKQISYLSQIWATLSGIATKKEGRQALLNVMSNPDALYPGSPYGYHYLVEALVETDLKSEANQVLNQYWGTMVTKGADTFWEVYDPTNDFLSPYNFYAINSYCHAWSCTPVYFINKYPNVFQK